MTMRYPIAIQPGDDTTAFGVVVPDLPGCFSAGDTLGEAMTGAEEAATLWIDATLESGGVVPPPRALDAIRNDPHYAGWAFGVISIDPALLDDRVERVNITCPAASCTASMRWRAQRARRARGLSRG